MYHVGRDRNVWPVKGPPAQVDRAHFQGALAAVHRCLEQFSSDQDLPVTPTLIQLTAEPVLNSVPVTMEMLGDCLKHSFLVRRVS